MFEHWEPGMAKVLDRKNLVNSSGTDESRWEYVVEVQASEFGESFRTEFKDPIGGTSVHVVTPEIGELAAAEVDWKRKEVKWDLKAPGRMSNDPLAGKHAQDARMQALLAGDSTTVAPMSDTATVTGDPLGPRPGAGPTIKIGPNANIKVGPGVNLKINPSATFDIDPAAHIDIDPSAHIDTGHAPGAADANGGVAAELASLAALHQQGMLSDEQFERAKNDALGLPNP